MSRGARQLPEEQQQALRRAWWLEVTWIIGLASIVVLLYLVMGNSQAMKTAWIEDLLGFVPPIAFLVATWVEKWPSSDRFPLGFIRGVSIGYLVSAVALAGVALFMIIDSGMALIQADHPTIGSMEMFGVTFWSGWLMIAVLVYSAILPVIFGRLKMRPGRILQDKILYADSLMNKADWMTGVAAIGGILGIGFGWWWADAVAAIVIALDVLYDGVEHTWAALRDLSDEMPRTIDDSEFDPLTNEVRHRVDQMPWVAASRVRLRQEGRFLTGTVYAVPRERELPPERLEEAEQELLNLNWRLHDISIMPCSRIG